jgi:hypothetical protein
VGDHESILPALGGGPAEPEPTREELEARVDQARVSIGRTVDALKDTIGERVDTVTDTVNGVITMSGQFQREPVAWSLGALSAGFAMGYSLGRAHHAKTTGGRPSKLARLADDVAAELATFGDALVSPGLAAELRQTFGVDLTGALARIAAQQTRPKPRPRAPSSKSAARQKRPAKPAARTRATRTRRKGS